MNARALKIRRCVIAEIVHEIDLKDRSFRDRKRWVLID